MQPANATPPAPGVVGSVGEDGCVEAEAAAGLPGEHVGDGVLTEKAAALEEAEHAGWRGGADAGDAVG